MRMPWSVGKENEKPRKRQGITDLLFTRAKMHWWLLGVISALAVYFIAFPMEEQRKALNSDDFKLTEKSRRDVIAQLDVIYSDEDATAAEKRKASTEVPPVFKLDFQRLDNAKKEFNVVRKTRAIKASLDLRFLPVLDNRDIIEDLRRKLERGDEQVSPSQDFGISVEEAGIRWLISSNNKDIYVVKKEEDKLNVYLTDTEKVSRMKHGFYIGPSDEVGQELAKVSDEDLDSMEKEVVKLLSDILAKGVIHGGENSSFIEDLLKIEYIKPKWERTREELEQQLDHAPTNVEIAAMMHVALVDTRSDLGAEKIVAGEELLFWLEATNAARDIAREMEWPISAVVEDFCVNLMRPNVKHDPILTQKRKVKLLTGFRPIRKTIPKGEKIVGVGDIITKPIKDKLDAMALAQARSHMLAIPGAMLLVGLLACALVVYLKKYEPSIFAEPRKVIALNIAILLVLVLGELVIISGPELAMERPGFLIPAAVAPIIIAMLTNVQLAIMVTCVIGVFIAMLAGVDLISSLEYFLVILAGGIAGAISASRARHRRHLIIAGLYVSVANVITILGLGLLESLPLVKLSGNSLIGAVNGAVVAVLTPGLLPIFEYLSRTTTDMELLELADLNQPLLTQLKGRSSGTYYHSLDISKLAEAAAEAVGANPLLARIGAYYHDIGKMTKPVNFIENQNGENVHDNLNPRQSVRVIAQHIKDGIRLATEHRLPQIVIDMIQQHHGTTLIGGQRFYQKAMEVDKHNSVRLEDYRYPGPKPQTKEAAILHLADSIESARRVLLNGNPSYSRLVSFVEGIVEGKIMDFQLDECDLTLKDIRSIVDAFVRVLSGMYHTRIEYPEAVEAAP